MQNTYVVTNAGYFITTEHGLRVTIFSKLKTFNKNAMIIFGFLLLVNCEKVLLYSRVINNIDFSILIKQCVCNFMNLKFYL